MQRKACFRAPVRRYGGRGARERQVGDGLSFLTGLRARALPLLAQTSPSVTASPDSRVRTHDRPRSRHYRESG